MLNEVDAFYGRESEIHLLFEAWLRANEGEPQWVALVAETGTGKTRLVQEFYRYISDLEYRNAWEASNPERDRYQKDYDPANYWPKSLPIAMNRLGLNPDPEGLSVEKIETLKDVPWLWWGLRGENCARRNPSENGCAARDALGHLELHIAILAFQQARDKRNLAAGMQIAKSVASFIPGVGSLIETAFAVGELLYAGKGPLKTLFTGLGVELNLERKTRRDALQFLLVDSILKFLEKGVPVVLVLDDAHWFDEDSAKFIQGLVEKVGTQPLKLMIISTSWAREWEGSGVQRAYSGFQGSCRDVNLRGIESAYTKSFLLDRFQGLTEADQNLLSERANGNFRYLTELVLALQRDPKRYFEGGDRAACLSADGRQRVGTKTLEMDQLIEDRFLELEERVQKALMRSSHQGVRFDPRLTSRVTSQVEGDGESSDAATMDAIHCAERPGAMICSIESDLREFLHGPYWPLIRKRQEEESDDFSATDEVYRELVMRDRYVLSDPIAEAMMLRWLDREKDRAERMRMRSWLLESAAKSGRYQAGLHQLRELGVIWAGCSGAEGLEELRRLSPEAALAALRVFNQYVFGADDQGLRQSLKEPLELISVAVLEYPIRLFTEDGGVLPAGRDLPELIEWCEALVEFRRGLGHRFTFPQWLDILCKLQKCQLELAPSVPRARLRYAANLVTLSEAWKEALGGREGHLEFLRKLDREAENQIDLLQGRERETFRARWAMSVLVYGEEGYPTIGKDGLRDFRLFSRSAEDLACVLDEMIEIEGSESPSFASGHDELGDGFLEILLRAVTLTVTYAFKRGERLAPEFLDRVGRLTAPIFDRIQSGGHVPVSLAQAALEANRIRASMLRSLSSRSDPSDSADVRRIPGVEIVLLESRRVRDSEALHLLDQICETGERYRQLGRLTAEMIVTIAKARLTRLELDSAGADDAKREFDRVIDDAVLIEDGRRLALSEQPFLLSSLVYTLDKRLSRSPDSAEFWGRLRGAYSRAGYRFDEVVAAIRAQQG